MIGTNEYGDGMYSEIIEAQTKGNDDGNEFSTSSTDPKKEKLISSALTFGFGVEKT